MFNFVKFFKRKSKIEIQIEVFLKWRVQRGMSLSSYKEWLLMFIEVIGKNDVYDVTPLDVNAFIDQVRAERNGQWPAFSAEKAVRQFIRFYTARGKMMGNLKEYQQLCDHNHVHRMTDLDRNRDLIQKRLGDSEKWSWRRLGAFYGIHHTTARQIYTRDSHKYFPKSKLSTSL